MDRAGRGAVDAGLASVRKASYLWRTPQKRSTETGPFEDFRSQPQAELLHRVPWIPRAASDLSVKLLDSESGDTKM